VLLEEQDLERITGGHPPTSGNGLLEPVVLFPLLLLVIYICRITVDCPPCGGRPFIRPLHDAWDAGPPCPDCHGSGRVSLLGWWRVVYRSGRHS